MAFFFTVFVFTVFVFTAIFFVAANFTAARIIAAVRVVAWHFELRHVVIDLKLLNIGFFLQIPKK